MIAKLVGMGSISITWLCLMLTICGLGFLVLRLVGLKPDGAEQSLSAFWIGWAALLAFLQIWHLFAPVGLIAVVPIVAGGAAGLAGGSLGEFTPWARRKLRKGALFYLAVCILALWLSNQAMGPIQNYDAGLYHLSAIKWTTSYRIVPGLGNLHGRLAFNSAYFLYAALLDTFPWTYRSFNLANGLLLLVLSVQIGLAFIRIAGRPREARPWDIMAVLLAGPVAHQWFYQASSVSPDLPVIILSLVVGLQLCRLLFSTQGIGGMTFDTFFILLLAALGVSIKLSFMPLGILAGIIAIGKVIVSRRGDRVWKAQKRSLALFVVPGALILVPWFVRGVILSGYAAYPSTFAPFPVDWRIPREQVGATNEAIMIWARAPGATREETLGSWSWLAPWLKKSISMARSKTGDPFNVAYPMRLVLLGGALVLYQLAWRKGISNLRTGMLVCLPALGSIVFWFFTAPDPRFGIGALWYLGAGLFTLAFVLNGLARAEIAGGLLLLSLIFCLSTMINEDKLIPPGPDMGYYPVPAAETQVFTTDSGLEILIPQGSDQCMDAPLPCTPYPDPRLRARVDQSVVRGFMISSEGERP